MSLAATTRATRWRAGLAVVAAMLLLAGLVLTPLLWRRLARHAEQRLVTAATLKREQLSDWRDRRLADAAVLSDSQQLADAVDRFLAKGSAADEGELLARFTSLRQHYGYADLLLVDVQLRVRVTLHDSAPELHPCLQPALAEAYRRRVPAMTDLHADELCDQPHVGIVAPLVGPPSRNRPVRAALVLLVHAPDELYPLLDAWPEPTRTGSTVLARRDGADVLYLNSPRGRHNAALTMRWPLTRRELPAVQAVLGAQGLIHGRNEQGVRVTAYVEPVANSSWYLASELADSELYGAARWQCLLLLLCTLALSGAAASLATGLWHRRLHHHFEGLFLDASSAGEQARLLRTLLGNLPGIAYRCANDDQWTMAFISSGCHQLTGYEADEMVGPDSPTYGEIIHADDRDAVWNDVQAALSERRAFELAYRIVRRDGVVRWVEEHGCGVFDGGQLQALEGFITDVTDRREAEDQVLLLSTALDHLDEAAFLTDRDGRLHYVNDGACRSLGYSREELLAMSVMDIDPNFPPERWPAHWEHMGVVGSRVFETIHQDKHGRQFPVEIHSKRISYGGAHYSMAMVRDISARREAEKAIEERLQSLTSPGEAPDVAFEDLFDMDELQRIQDAFAAATGVASIITHVDGTPLTRPSNFCRLCDIVRGTKKGLANCICSDAMIGRQHSGGPVVQPCLSGGLWDAGASINVGGRHVANWLIGQVRNEALEESHLLAYGREIGADETAYREALSEVTVMSSERFESVAQALYLVASTLSQIAYQNVLQAREIHSRRRAEAALAESELRLEAAQAIAHVGHWEYQTDTEVLTWSAEVYRIFGVTEEQFGGRQSDFADMVHPDDRDLVLSAYEESMERGEEGFDIEHRLIRGDTGEIRWVHEKCVHERDANGQMVRSVGMVQDVTERKHTEAERLRLTEQLAQAQKMESVGRLAGGVAHDFNNMLGVILGQVELALAELPEESSLHADLLDVQQAAQRSADLTRQLLAFARRQTVLPRQLDLNETVTDSLKMLRRLIGEHIDLVWAPGTGLWPVRMDPTQVDQMLANLCVNARDAINGIGRVSITTQNLALSAAQLPPAEGMPPGDWVLLSVTDTGCGMDEATAAQVFEPFFTTKEVGQGTGLGLATVYGVVRQNDGFIAVDSQPEAGSTFRIYLPRFVVEQAAAVATTTAVPHGAGQTILLVEDEPAILRMAHRLLDALGYQVVTAPAPSAALALLDDADFAVDLLMTDVVMPEMNGRDLAEQCQARRPGLACLFMSGYTADVIAHQGVLDPGMRFIQKPFTRADLADAVHEALGGARSGG